MTEWRDLAAGLADTVAGSGATSDPRWLDALRAVPRHILVPRFHRQRDGRWETVEEIAEVYRDVPLVTALLPDERGEPTVVSSSTKPGLMVRMLDALDVRDGQEVLEIGTGTGYGAALLDHVLGPGHVHSVDVGGGLVDLARRRLASLGRYPVLAAGDGLAGLPAHAPYDRIVATCSVPAVPWAWFEQVRPGGLVLVDLKIGLHAGSLVLLRRDGNRLTGRFLPRWAGFMPARDTDAAPAARRPAERSGPAEVRTPGSTPTRGRPRALVPRPGRTPTPDRLQPSRRRARHHRARRRRRLVGRGRAARRPR
jgi:protein-L-isoaspartate O-methyltransferase